MRVIVADGWVKVPYPYDERARVKMRVGVHAHPAYLDWHEGVRVAQVRVPDDISLPGTHVVQLVVNGTIVESGRVTL